MPWGADYATPPHPQSVGEEDGDGEMGGAAAERAARLEAELE